MAMVMMVVIVIVTIIMMVIMVVVMVVAMAGAFMRLFFHIKPQNRIHWRDTIGRNDDRRWTGKVRFNHCAGAFLTRCIQLIGL